MFRFGFFYTFCMYEKVFTPIPSMDELKRLVLSKTATKTGGSYRYEIV